MKSLAAFLLLLLIGLICGVSVATINIAFEPKHCGEDCSNTALASLFTWLPLCTATFPIVGLFLWSHFGRTGKNLFFIISILVLLALIPTGVVYFYRAILLN